MPKKEKPIEEFPGNSKSSRVAPIRQSRRIEEEGAMIEEPKRVKRIGRGLVVRKKKTFTQSIAEALVGDSTNSVGGYILYDVLIPAFKSLVTDAVTSGIEMLVYGETRGRGRERGRDKDRTIVSYGSYYKRDRDRDDDRREHRRPQYRDKFDLNDIYFKDHNDAEEVLDALCDMLEEYEQVSVADYFELAGIDGATHAHYKWGWTNLKKAYNTHTRHGWGIVLPDPIELD